jgi:hypothetical protein
MAIRYPIAVVYLEWEDASSRSPWMDETEIEEFDRSSFMIRQVGFLLKETSRCLLFAAQWAPEDEFTDAKFGNVIRVPKTWVRKRKLLLTVNADGELKMRHHDPKS